MYKNYFFLNRFIVEINSVLKDSILLSAFSQEKNKLILEIKKDEEIKFLEIFVNPGFPYVNLKDSYHRARKNSIDFFSEYLPAKIHSFEIAEEDRILRLNSDSLSIYFLIRGKYTNIALLAKNNELENFKNPPDGFNKEEFLNKMSSLNFIKNYNVPQFKLTESADIREELKTKYPFVGKEIISEAKIRVHDENNAEIISELTRIIEEIFNEKPAAFINQKLLEVNLGISSFNIFSFTEKILFENMISAFNFFISKKFYFEQLAEKKKRIQKHLNKELIRLSSKMNKLKGTLEKGSKEKEYLKLGNLLLINLSSIHKGMEGFEVNDIYNENKPLTIKLDETCSPKQNADQYFEKAKNDRIRYEKSKQLFNQSVKNYDELKRVEKKLFEAEEPEDYSTIMKELNLKEEREKKSTDNIQNKFKHYIIENKYNVFVGKNNKNNDLLTIKFARQNDYWFHARSVPGSHTVLRVDNVKEAVPKNILKKAASLAAFHSKAKTAGTVPVSFTLKKYVIKKKGMEAGKVTLLKEDTLLVKPEIPDKCEYIANS